MIVFSYVNLLKESPYLQSAFDEVKAMSELRFKYQEKTSASVYTSNLSHIMHTHLLRDRLLSQKVFRRFDHSDVQTYLRPDNFRLIIVSQKCSDG